MFKIFRRDRQYVPIAQRKYRSYVRLRWMCRSFTAGAIAFSIWCNSLFAAGDLIAVIMAGIAPLFVLGGLEMMSRVKIRGVYHKEDPWFAKVGVVVKRSGRPFGTLTIVGVAAWLSYWTQRAAIAQHLPDDHARLLPWAIDGFMLISSITLQEINDRLEEIEVAQEVAQQRKPKAPEAVPVSAPPADRRGAKRERIAQILSQQGDGISTIELAGLAGVSESYAAKCRRELRDELVSA